VIAALVVLTKVPVVNDEEAVPDDMPVTPVTVGADHV
jgi:hypothetical protein